MTVAAASRGAGRNARAVGLPILLAAVRLALRRWLARRILAQAIDELRAVDNRMLVNIGLERSELEIACRYARRRVQHVR